MKRALVGLLVACVTVGIASVASATDNPEAAISVHLTPPVAIAKTCDNIPVVESKTIETGVCGAPLDGYTAWVLVCNGSDSLGVAGMEFGINYDGALDSGVDVEAWVLCADLEFPSVDWPDAGSGSIVTWNSLSNCQDTPSEPFVPRTVVAIAGALHLTYYSPDFLTITPRPVSGKIKVANCNAAEEDLTGLVPSHAGIGSFCYGDGYNPCGGPTATETTTWGNIKQQFNN